MVSIPSHIKSKDNLLRYACVSAISYSILDYRSFSFTFYASYIFFAFFDTNLFYLLKNSSCICLRYAESNLAVLAVFMDWFIGLLILYYFPNEAWDMLYPLPQSLFTY